VLVSLLQERKDTGRWRDRDVLGAEQEAAVA